MSLIEWNFFLTGLTSLTPRKLITLDGLQGIFLRLFFWFSLGQPGLTSWSSEKAKLVVQENEAKYLRMTAMSTVEGMCRFDE